MAAGKAPKASMIAAGSKRSAARGGKTAQSNSQAWQRLVESSGRSTPAGELGKCFNMVTAADAMKLFESKRASAKPVHQRYNLETYMFVTRWTEGTKLKYGPNPKTKGSKSYTRFAKYAKARTVGEALALGAYPPDLLWDLERGFYKVLGGPMRDEPVDLNKAKAEEAPLTRTDRVLGKWVLREICRELGTDIKTLQGETYWAESALVHALRLLADREAEKVVALASAEGRQVTGGEVLRVLRRWQFYQNPWRGNVMREGQTWVFSDTLGVNCGRDGSVHATTPTPRYPNVVRLLCRWIRDRQPADLRDTFHFTSINMNYGYAARRHRDGNNVGLSMLAAFGDFEGGQLRYWPDDDKTLPVEGLPAKECKTVDLKKELLLFDGQRCHEVAPFKGERFSLVWFSCARYRDAGEATLRQLSKLGFVIPTDTSVKALSSRLRPPLGCGAARREAATQREKQDGMRTWPSGCEESCKGNPSQVRNITLKRKRSGSTPGRQ